MNITGRKRVKQSETVLSQLNEIVNLQGKSGKREPQRKAFKITKTSDKKEQGNRKASLNKETLSKKNPKETKTKFSNDPEASSCSNPVDILTVTTHTEKNSWGKSDKISKSSSGLSSKKEKSKKISKDRFNNFLFKDSRKKREPKKMKRQHQGDDPIIHFSLSSQRI